MEAAYSRKVQYDDSAWELVNEQGVLASCERDYIDLVIVNEARTTSRHYYEGDYEQGASRLPTCWTGDDNRGPDITANKKQHTSCVLCKQNIRGSASYNTKACRVFTRIAVGFITDKETAQGVFQLQLPSSSLFGTAPDKKNAKRLPYTAYKKSLDVHGYKPEQMITRISQDEKVSYKKLLFEAVGFVPETFTLLVEDLTNSVDAISAVKTKFTVEEYNPFKPIKE